MKIDYFDRPSEKLKIIHEFIEKELNKKHKNLLDQENYELKAILRHIKGVIEQQ